MLHSSWFRLAYSGLGSVSPADPCLERDMKHLLDPSLQKWVCVMNVSHILTSYGV